MSEQAHNHEDARDDAGELPLGVIPRKRRGLSRRAWTLLFSLVLVVALGLVGGLVRIPYVALGPGPTFDTLGTTDAGAVVEITGHQTYPTSGQLRMVTVSLTDDMSLFGALGLWMSGQDALAPREEYYQPGQSDQQVDQENAQEFQQSQTDAEVAALRYLKYPIEVLASSVESGSPAATVIHSGDQIVSINGIQPTSETDVFNALVKTTPGQVIPVSVRSGSQPVRQLQIKLASSPDRKQGFLGVTPTSQAEVPFTINIRLNDIGGPSAGLMFALAIVDKLTPDNVNGGMVVAGTGEIDDLGNVQPIGGISFKLVAARQAGATVFLTPADNCAEASSHVPAGLRLVKVTSLDDAITELANLKKGLPVPGC